MVNSSNPSHQIEPTSSRSAMMASLMVLLRRFVPSTLFRSLVDSIASCARIYQSRGSSLLIMVSWRSGLSFSLYWSSEFFSGTLWDVLFPLRRPHQCFYVSDRLCMLINVQVPDMIKLILKHAPSITFRLLIVQMPLMMLLRIQQSSLC